MIGPRRIGTKMLLTMCVPLAAMGGMAGYVHVESGADRAVVATDVALATSAVGPDGLVALLQQERARTSLDLLALGASAEGAVPPLGTARSSVDAARTAFGTGVSPIAADAFASAASALDDLRDIRRQVDDAVATAGSGNVSAADEVFAAYTAVIDSLLDSTTQAVSAVDDADLHRHATALDLAGRIAEADSRVVRHLVVHTVLDDLTSPGVLRDTAGLVAARDTLLDRLAAVLDPTLADAQATMLADRAAFDSVVDRAVNTGAVDLGMLLATSSATDDNGSPIGLEALRRATVRSLLSEVGLQTDASREQQIIVVLALLGLAGSIAAAIAGSRAVTRPLRRLVERAETIATDALPAAVERVLAADPGSEIPDGIIEPIDITSRDEVGVLAAAVDRVQRAALGQAVEQATLRRHVGEAFVNLGRRNQTLVDRQLEFITELQRNEHDPDVLRDLFRLDHLATRMRRNAESLLLLAGEAPDRVWSDPVPLVDVVRGALGEVEDYRRVEIDSFAPVAVTGTLVADVGHMLAELIENALAFSPPQRPVLVDGALIGDAFRISVRDAGVGMVADEIDEANNRLSGAETFTIPPSRYLGHYVTGQLAQRHGLSVRLVSGTEGGITAEVDVPAELLWLPEDDSTAPGATETPIATHAPAADPTTVLVDEPAPAAPEPVLVTPAPVTTPPSTLVRPEALADRAPLPKRVRGANLPLAAAPIVRADPLGSEVAPVAGPARRVPESRPAALSTEAGSVFELFNGIRSGEAERDADALATNAPGVPT